MADDLPNSVIGRDIISFVDRSTWDNLVVVNREIYQESRNLKAKAPWPVGELIRGAGHERDEIIQICFSSDGDYFCVLSWGDHGLAQQSKIRMWHKVVGSCGCSVFSLSNSFDPTTVYGVCFSPVENLLASLHEIPGRRKAFRLWEVNAEGLAFKVEVRLDYEVNVFSLTFSRDGRYLILYCKGSTLRIYSVSEAQLIKVIHLVRDRQESFQFVGITANGRKVVCVETNKTNHLVCLWDIHGGGSPVEDVCVCQKGESVSYIAISPLDDSIAIMLVGGVSKVAHRCARDMAWTVEVMADGLCFETTVGMSFSTNGQLLATVRAEGGIEIWDAIKGKCLRTIVCDQFWKLEFSPDGSILAATTSSDDRLCLYNI
jgi:WD40 repeat protein